jgi:hypothetical protein
MESDHGALVGEAWTCAHVLSDQGIGSVDCAVHTALKRVVSLTGVDTRIGVGADFESAICTR